MKEPSLPINPSLQRIDADFLIPGKGEPINNGTVVFEEKTILFAGSWNALPTKYQSIKTTHVPVVMPGMWDCHIHYYGKTIGGDDFHVTPQGLAAARSVADARATFMAGFTSVREVGGYGCTLSVAISEGRIVGPTIYAAHSPISMTAGHGDKHNYHIDDVTHACSRGVPFAIADGVDECIRTVRLQLRNGARCIKICASGGVASLRDDPHHQEFSHEEIKAMVDEAARAHRVVAAHCHGKVGIMAALRGGCKTIEHGSYLDEEAIDLMLEKDAILVPTRMVIEIGLATPDMFQSPTSYQKLIGLAADHKKSYALAVLKGVKIALGTDLFTSTDKGIMAYGNSGKELAYAVGAGMTPLQAIEAATANGPLTVGDQAPLTGQLKEGYESDIIAISSNPLDDINVLADRRNVTHIWQGGKLKKFPGMLADM